MTVQPQDPASQGLINFDDDDRVRLPRADLRDPQRRDLASQNLSATVCDVLSWARSRHWTSKQDANTYKVLMALCRVALWNRDDTFKMTVREVAEWADITEHREVRKARDRLAELGVVEAWNYEVAKRKYVTQWQVLVPAGWGVCSNAPLSPDPPRK